MERGSSSVLRVVLQERGHGEVAAGRQREAGRGTGGTGPGDTAVPARGPHPAVSARAAHTDHRLHFADPSRTQTSVLFLHPHNGKGGEDAQPCPAGGGSKVAGQDPQPAPSPPGHGEDPGEHSHYPKEAGEECVE